MLSFSYRILRPGGLVFFREAHFTPVGDRVTTDEGNPAIYRSIMVITHCTVFTELHILKPLSNDQQTCPFNRGVFC